MKLWSSELVLIVGCELVGERRAERRIGDPQPLRFLIDLRVTRGVHDQLDCSSQTDLVLNDLIHAARCVFAVSWFDSVDGLLWNRFRMRRLSWL